MDDWSALAAIVTLAILTEAIVEYFAPSFPTRWRWTKMYLAAVLAVLVCLAYGADLPAALGLKPVPWVGPILTGMIIGRGANFISILAKRGQVITAPAQPVDSVPTTPRERLQAIRERQP